MQNDKQKYLKDIYFDEKKMDKFRDNCIKNQEYYKNKIALMMQELMDVKTKIKAIKVENAEEICSTLFCKKKHR